MRAAVCFERRLPRLPRFAGRSGTLDVGHVFSPRFLSCNKKGGRPPGRNPGICAKRRSLNEGRGRSSLRVRPSGQPLQAMQRNAS